MKRFTQIIGVFVIAILLGCASKKEVVVENESTEVSTKQDSRNAGGSGVDVPTKRKLSAEELADQLNLSKEQRDRFITHQNSLAPEMKAIRETYKDDRAGMMEAMKDLKASRKETLKTILSVEQMKKYLEISNRNKRVK